MFLRVFVLFKKSRRVSGSVLPWNVKTCESAVVSCAVTPLQQGRGGFGNQLQVVMAGLARAEKFMKNKKKTLCRWWWWRWEFRSRQGSKMDSASQGREGPEGTEMSCIKQRGGNKIQVCGNMTQVNLKIKKSQGHGMWNEKAIQNKRWFYFTYCIWLIMFPWLPCLPHQSDIRLRGERCLRVTYCQHLIQTLAWVIANQSIKTSALINGWKIKKKKYFHLF